MQALILRDPGVFLPWFHADADGRAEMVDEYEDACAGFTAAELDCALAAPDVASVLEDCPGVETRPRPCDRLVALDVDAIRKAEETHMKRHGWYRPCAPMPPEIPTGDDVFHYGPGVADFEALDWSTRGGEPCRYSVTVTDAPAPEGGSFVVTAECDLDGDGEIAVFRADQDRNCWAETPEGVR